MTRFFGKTLREEPAEAETVSHRLLLKSGMIRQVASGVYSYLPLAWRSLRKIEGILRQEMDAAGGQEVRMPALHPLELWEESGRAEAFGQTLFTLKDRRDRPLVMAPTHEEVITLMVKANVQSYRDLPQLLYQIQAKFRDEARPRGGLLRVREFDMKDAYSFDADDEGLARSYDAMVQAYKNIYRRCGLPAVQVEADSGAIGGKDSHEFILATESGEDVMLLCPGCGYSANAERAESVKPPRDEELPLPLSEVHTPGVKTIEDLAAFLGIPRSRTLKAVFYASDGQVVFITIRGDLDVNEVKLKNLLHCRELRLATEGEVEGAGLVAGSASPAGMWRSFHKEGIAIIADDSIKLGSNFVVGANRPDYHLRNANYPRDFEPDVIADIALAQAGHACRRCGTPLEAKRGIEVGHVFKLGTFFTERLEASFLDREGVQRPIIMGCYGIGVGRLLAAAIEQNHDEKGIVFPSAIAPYQVHLVALNVEDTQVAQAAEDLYQRLEQVGLEVLYDDRQESAGVKLNDADLLGFPVRIVVSPRNLRQGSAEVKRRRESEAQMVALEGVVGMAKSLLEADSELS
jgi:prolyl-tRNA synthetase